MGNEKIGNDKSSTAKKTPAVGLTVYVATYNLLRTLGLTTVFGNPGSTEQPFSQIARSAQIAGSQIAGSGLAIIHSQIAGRSQRIEETSGQCSSACFGTVQ